MARNEKTSPDVATIAARVLKRGWAMPGEARKLAASCLTQAADRASEGAGWTGGNGA